MKTALALTIMALLSTTAKANIETFDTAASAAASGFILDPLIFYIDPGRPYMDDLTRQDHTITYAPGTFTFNSMEFNAYPQQNISWHGSLLLNMVLKDIAGITLLDTSITLSPDKSIWTVYTNNVPGVHQIYFPFIVNASNSYPSFDNLTYNSTPFQVPEPESLLLFLMGLFLIFLFRKKASISF